MISAELMSLKFIAQSNSLGFVIEFVFFAAIIILALTGLCIIAELLMGAFIFISMLFLALSLLCE